MDAQERRGKLNGNKRKGKGNGNGRAFLSLPSATAAHPPPTTWDHRNRRIRSGGAEAESLSPSFSVIKNDTECDAKAAVVVGDPPLAPTPATPGGETGGGRIPSGPAQPTIKRHYRRRFETLTGYIDPFHCHKNGEALRIPIRSASLTTGSRQRPVHTREEPPSSSPPPPSFLLSSQEQSPHLDQGTASQVRDLQAYYIYIREAVRSAWRDGILGEMRSLPGLSGRPSRDES